MVNESFNTITEDITVVRPIKVINESVIEITEVVHVEISEPVEELRRNETITIVKDVIVETKQSTIDKQNI
jgi:uncharacterized protein (DUF39 family)